MKSRDELFGVIIHIYMEISQGNGEEEGGTGPAQRGKFGTSARGEVAEKGCRRVKMVQKMCTHVFICKNDTC
jgi:hypothetical protein